LSPLRRCWKWGCNSSTEVATAQLGAGNQTVTAQLKWILLS
jgi:hypothetical protein